ncbi:amidase [Ktedonobacter sp. SOSP1-52]|uniref:amidase n=1 Tax=Ktedonobacter sp. SOSP1-52 TaxID=2778366 RepID=UPI001914E334|nr:amidase [Ktedonobacter sp. SOSP1-52]
MNIQQAATLLQSGQVSCVQIVQDLLQRIDELDPTFHAWITVDQQGALAQAQQLDEELATAGPRGALHGIPVGCKDLLYTSGIKTTACSPLYADFVPASDATVVSRLKQAGAIILGKTMCTEFAVNDPAPTVHAWQPAHTPGGSSSGSAVAVATRMCFATIDTQTAGDILRPAAYNGVIGLKPTYGRISRAGVLPVAWSLDTMGVTTRSVEDTAFLLQVLAGHDSHDTSSASVPVPNYAATLTSQPMVPRLGLIRQYFYAQADPEVCAHTDQVAETLHRAGAQVEEITLPEDLSLLHAAHRIIVSAECAAYHQELFSAHPEQYGPKIRQFIQGGMLTPAVSYLQAQRLRSRWSFAFQDLFRHVDVLLTPAAPSAAPADRSTTGSPVFQIPWTLCGFPSLSLPSGLNTNQLPLGVQLVGAAWQEERLLAVARWCERTLHLDLLPPCASIS